MKQVRYLTVALFCCLICSCKVGRFVYYNFADIKDYKKFANRPITAPSQTFQYPAASNLLYPTLTIDDQKYNFDNYLANNNTVAFLIIHKDSIVYEKYFNKYDQDNIVTSFSMAKSILSILIGFAIQEGKILSIDEPITNYIPELKKNGFDKVTIEHLLQMTSGIDFKEAYTDPFGDAATFYYGRTLRKSISKMKLKNEPGTKFEYTSGTTQLLGLVLERALKTQTITAYLQDKLWTPLGMEYDASWSIDKKKDGIEKTFCCINARARDFAKIGTFFLHKGQWKGQQLLNEDWVYESTKVDTSKCSDPKYQYQWRLLSGDGDYFARGILGQYIYVNPNKDLVIVRLGKNKGKANWDVVFQHLAHNIQQKNQHP